MAKDYVEPRHESFYLIGSRVPLVRIVYEFKNGEAPEAIQSHFPTLSLEQVYGAITFYLGNKDEVERDILEQRRIEEEIVKTQPPLPPELQEKLNRARERMLSRTS
jgi:uncharacterized protein (DUF433 family)